MPYRIKTPSKRQILEPEALIDRYERLGDWVMDHLQPIGIVGGILIVGAIGWGVFTWVGQRTEESAAILQAEAFKVYQAATDPTRQQRVLAPETITSYEQAIAGFQKVRDAYPNTTQAAIALYQQGNAYAALGRYDEAISTYQHWLKEYRAPEMVPLVGQRLAYAYWAKGSPQDALARFDEVIKMKDAPNRDQAYFETGRILEQQGHKDQALTTYNTLATDYPSSPWGSEAVARIIALGGTPPRSESAKTPPTPDAKAPNPQPSP
ncbi:MAG: tetratricopeptide repeat protein [Nitrospiria bacterium]